MKMTFGEYFLFLAHRPLKLVEESRSQIAIFLKVIGSKYDDAKQAVFSIRKNANIMTASEKALSLHGEDRRLDRYDGESVEAYRERLLAKQEVARLAGTRKGIIKGVQSLGYSEVDIIRTADYIPDNWAEFFVVLNADEARELENVPRVWREVMHLKEASAMPNISFAYKTDLGVNALMKYGFQDPPIAGAYTCGQGAVRL
jgi:hypothetical protein